ncbi:hypothetical protein [Legionella clemsonensis]|nr:hypothetical protein [Legionella clemsonensis]
MATIIQSIFEDEGFTPIRNRFFTVFKPIQSVRKLGGKHSDFLAYLLNPVIDIVLIPAFLIDIAIDVTNMVISLIKAFHYWSHNQQRTSRLFDEETQGELGDVKEHFLNAVAALFSAVLNPIFSLLSLFTRPVASVVKAVADACNESSSASCKV